MSPARRRALILAASLLALTLTSCREASPAPDPPAVETPSPVLTPPPTPTPNPTPEPTPEPTPAPPPEVPDEEFVRVADYIPSIYTELKYATEDNFTGSVIYDFTEAYLRYGTVKKLTAAQETLLGQGYSLLIWDAYRPREAQFALWEVCPDPVYVETQLRAIPLTAAETPLT